MTTTLGEGSLMEERPVHQQASGGSSPAPSLQSFWVTECSKSEIAAFIEEHHYSKNVKGVTASICFRVDRDRELVGAAIFGPPAMKQTQDKYSDRKLRMLELRRLCFIDDTPKCTESKMIGLMLRKLAKRGIERVLSYCDPNHGHYGISYRGAGFHCLGQTAPITEIWWQGRKWSTRSLNHYVNDDRSLGFREDALELRAALERGEAVKVLGVGKYIFVKDLADPRRREPAPAITALAPPPIIPLAPLAVLTLMALRSPQSKVYTTVRRRRRTALSTWEFSASSLAEIPTYTPAIARPAITLADHPVPAAHTASNWGF